MRLVGDAIAKTDAQVPLLGIFPWGATHGRERLEAAIGQCAGYAGAAASSEGAPRNPHHTHCVPVDNGKEGCAAWGSEISLRSNLEATVSHRKHVPIVQLVVSGGPGTLKTAHAGEL